MPLYVVIKKPIKEDIFDRSNTDNPTAEELLKDLESYSQIYLLKTLADAKKVAELFAQTPAEPNTTGSYGLIAQVTVEFSDWPNSIRKEDSDIDCEHTIISSSQVKSISRIFIPDMAKAYNANLRDTIFAHTEPEPQCLTM